MRRVRVDVARVVRFSLEQGFDDDIDRDEVDEVDEVDDVELSTTGLGWVARAG